MRKVVLAGKELSSECPYIIAEAGVNHNGETALAVELVREAKRCGADCVKFQTFKAERVATANAPKAAYQLISTDAAESQIAMLRKLELSEAGHREVVDVCRAEGITFLSTPYSTEDAEFLDSLGVPGFKIASGQIVETPFLEVVARFGKPLILSTGMSTMAEITRAVDAIRRAGNDQIVLLQCTTNYPSSLTDVNLRAMQQLEVACRTQVGYSDHTDGITACVAAAALGAVVIEKHFTLDRHLPGPDHRCSCGPAEFRSLVRAIRDVELVLGDGNKQPTATELANLSGMRRSLVAKTNIALGQRVTAADFAFKRPATGLAPSRLHEFEGRVARQTIPADTQITPDMFT